MSLLGALPARFRRERVLIIGCGDVGQRAARALGSGRRVRLLALTSSPSRCELLRRAGGISDDRYDAWQARLHKQGAKVTRLKSPEVAEALGLAATLFTAEAYGIWRDAIEAAPQKMFPRILERVRAGADVKASDYVAAWRRLRVIRDLWAEMSAGYDAVMLPTAAILPPDANRLMTDFDYYISENLLSLRNTRIGNLMDVCALTLPTAEPSCGISFMAGPMQEDRLLRLGIAAERALA